MNYTKTISYRGVTYLLTSEEEKKFNQKMESKARELAEPYEDSEEEKPEYRSSWEIKKELDEAVPYVLYELITDAASEEEKAACAELFAEQETLIGELISSCVYPLPYPFGSRTRDIVVTLPEAAKANVRTIVGQRDDFYEILSSYGIDANV